ncbi:amidase [Actinomadura rugatobispora]|uniref:Amidase n=1 Tax=Actinomadura rugatobispora TaxID=1994 RepID=A0ABW1A1D0_9ACTN|nr:amidase family protein [Actinomadura rugatobispora]
MTARFADLGLEEYRAASGVELGRRVARGELSPVQLTECALHLARAAEPVINAYAALLPERALRQAAELEAEAAAGRVRGPLHGVPMAVKDNMLYEGEPTGKGSRTSPGTPATASSPMVERLLAAGTVVIGKTTTPEFGWKGTGISPRTGVTRNPWNPARNSGGSSAGAGATVASGAVPIATGTDAGGSVRIPAAFCGVVGLKPTLGAIPVWPGTVNENLSHAGPLTRHVDDARAVLDITRGPDPRDPQSYHARPPAGSPSRRMRVGVVRAPFGVPPGAEVAPAVDAALELLAATLTASDAAEFQDVDLPARPPREIFEALWVTGRGLGFRDLIRERAEVMDPGLVRLATLAEGYDLAAYYAALTRRREFNAELHRCLDEWDLLVMPTMPIAAFAADAEVPEGGEIGAPLPWITWTPYTYPFNITGQPAITLPVGLGAGRMPAGVQIVGPWAHDDALLAFARLCERALAPLNETTVVPAGW